MTRDYRQYSELSGLLHIVRAYAIQGTSLTAIVVDAIGQPRQGALPDLFHLPREDY